jgi:glycosyltransferase involved in cell wall biosynthesis
MAQCDCSIIICNYNKDQKQIEECIHSVQFQTVSAKEIILVDDHSDKPYAHSSVMSIVLPKNVGVSKARDVGVKMSTGKLILFVDADDMLAPDFIEQCLIHMDKYSIAYPNVLLFGEVERPSLWTLEEEISPEVLISKSNKILVTSMMHREVYEKLGGFRTLPIYEDWDFWIRAAFNGYTFHRANTILWYRQNGGKSRNSATQELRQNIHHQITAPYSFMDGRIVCRESESTLQKTD